MDYNNKERRVYMNAKTILDEVKQLKDEIIQNRRYLHLHPGIGFDIKETIQYVEKKLTEMNYEVHHCGKAGLYVMVGTGKPTFLIRGDMDALPIKEESGLDFASTNGYMHACGHDMHTAMMLGAAKILKQHESELKGTVKLMFQPAEEIFEGSKDMIDHGILEDVDQAMMMHVMANFPLPEGSVVVSAPGVSAPAADYFEIEIQGKGCHGSMPNMGVDPINIAAHVIVALQEINARELSLSNDAVVTIGSIHAGKAQNAIADMAKLGGTIRTYDEQTRTFIKQRMQEIVSGVAQTFRGEGKVIFGSGCPTLVNDEQLSLDTTKYAEELLGKEKAWSVAKLQEMTKSPASKSTGSEDFAYVSQEVPSIMVALAAGMPDKGYGYPQHHPRVKFDEEALVNGCALYAYTPMRWLEEHCK